MTTTSSTGSTSTTTATTSTTAAATTASVNASAAQQLLSSLNSGSGVDTSSLVTSLVNAQFATKVAALQAKSDALTTKISDVSTLKGQISDFAGALESLVKGGTLVSQPASSNPAAVSVTPLVGAKLDGLSGSITVSQLASAQTAVSTTALASRNAAVGTGQLTLTLGTATYNADGSMASFAAGSGTPTTITIDSSNNSLNELAASINKAGAGVTASVITDADGSAYLSLKGASGAAQAFTLTATTDDDGTLSAFNVGPGTAMRIASPAQNAKLTLDGVAVERTSNAINDLVQGLQINLTATSSTPVTLSSTTPTTALNNAVNDFVDTFNQVFAALKTQIDPINGDLRADSAAQALYGSLRRLTTQTLVSNAAPGTPATLADLGVTTNRDGSLSVDATKLTNAVTSNPAAVEAIFSYATIGSDGLNAAMQSIKASAISTVYGLGASAVTYTKAQGDIATQQDDLTAQQQQMSDRLTQQFAAMNAKVAAYKSTQAYMTQQISMWTKSGSN
ncbi:flagellar filament capping protein FliD [Sphingomonas sp. CL5.1]|uniref:flagellar filament capping protein FliD n=1 Tax=Sphingomonas sp. CL5.1 TaxID=2653203 RepID=UPI001581D41D|nr:flagellar filament capping protein FliD [Sphingomonas sp. CL5.1]QKR98993.1 flagellar filament capping protein FliD [Sphingomonas sp. CL5.1]